MKKDLMKDVYQYVNLRQHIEKNPSDDAARIEVAKVGNALEKTLKTLTDENKKLVDFVKSVGGIWGNNVKSHLVGKDSLSECINQKDQKQKPLNEVQIAALFQKNKTALAQLVGGDDEIPKYREHLVRMIEQAHGIFDDSFAADVIAKEFLKTCNALIDAGWIERGRSYKGPIRGICDLCVGDGEIGGQFSGGLQTCPSCNGTGKDKQ